jgi:hypothetical protein
MDVEENALTGQCSPRWPALTRAALGDILVDFGRRRLPHRRIAKLAGLLLLSGDDPRPAWAARVIENLTSEQRQDGGWVDCEDTAWCTFVLSSLGSSDRLGDALRWLGQERSGDAWGYCRRDAPCIPITSTIRILLPALCDSRSTSWLRSAWSRDIQAPVRLSYKAAWYLLAGPREEDPSGGQRLREATKELLLDDQRPDGAWGPWRDHPAASDCFCTGIVMWALASLDTDDRIEACLTRARQWCARQCLPNGLFPTHFIEEGSAWVYVGCSHAYRASASQAAKGTQGV